MINSKWREKEISYLDLRPSNPANGRQLILQQQVVCLIIKAPLADGQVSTGAFDLQLKTFNFDVLNYKPQQEHILNSGSQSCEC